jgi:hypothetical protein
MKPKIEVHSLLHNEAHMIPYFVLHYSQFADIFFYESDSTDGSREIAEALGAKVISLPTENVVNELVFLQMKNNCWKDSKADWVIIGDTDEFVYHPNLVDILEKTKYNMFYPKEWRMIAREFPTTEGQIYDEVKYGFPGDPGYNKMNIFRPNEIKEMNYEAGCHSCHPEGNIKLCPDTDIVTLHFHDVGIEYRLKRNVYLASRISQVNKDRGWGVHVTWTEEKIRADFEANMKKAVRVIP